MTKEELEKEATEYAQKLGAKDFIAKPKEIVAYFGYLAGAEPREKQIAELEKENAELKKDKKELCHSISEGGKACVYLNGQLTKAKKLLNKWLFFHSGPKDYPSPLQSETEQFISEVEK